MRCRNCGWVNDDNKTLCVKCHQSLISFSPSTKNKPQFETYYTIEAICCNCGHWQKTKDLTKQTCPKCQNKCIQLQTVSKSRLDAQCPECGYCTHNDVAFCPFCGSELEKCMCLLPEDHWNVDIPTVDDCLSPIATDYILIKPLNNGYFLCQKKGTLKVGIINSENVLMTDLKYDTIEPFCKCCLPGPGPLPPESEWFVGAFYKDKNEVGFIVEDANRMLSEYIRWTQDIYYRRCKLS